MIKRKVVKMLFASIVMILSIVLVSCKGNDKTTETKKVTVESISLDTTNVKTEYIYGEEFTAEGLVITANMSDGTKVTVPIEDVIISSPNMDLPGKRNVTVTYQGKTAKFFINIVEYFPPISETSLIDIDGINEEVAYRVEAEDFDFTVSETKAVNDEGLVKIDTSESLTSGGKYLTNYGVKGNYFGFTFTSDEEYENVIIVMRMSYDGDEILDLSKSLTVYLNYVDEEETNEIEINKVLNPHTSENELNWQDVVLRNITIPKGTNKLTFRVRSTEVPNIDYIDFYVGKRYINSVVEITRLTTTVIKEFEDFDTERIVNRQDMIDHHGLKPGEVFVEPAITNVEGTSKGTSAAGFTTGTEISTTIRVAEKTKIEIIMVAASVEDYRISEEWEFYINGVKLEDVDDINIKDGDPGKMEYWKWKEVSLGKYELEAGDHFFTAKLIGSFGCNVDIFKFKITDLVVTVSEVGVKHKIEAEDLDYSEGYSVETPRGNAYHITSGHKSVGNISVAGNTFGFRVNSMEAAEAVLNIFAAYGGSDILNFDDKIMIKVNGEIVETEQTLTKDEGPAIYGDIKQFAPHQAFFWNWKKISVNISLEKGLNKIEFIVLENEGIPNFDKFELIITKYGDSEVFTVPEIMKEDVQVVINGVGTYKVEAEDADFSEAALVIDNLNAGHIYTEKPFGAAEGATSGLSVGKFGIQGNIIKVYVYSEEAYDNVSIKFVMANPERESKKVDDTLVFRLNDTPIVAGEDVELDPYNDEYLYWNWDPFVISGLTLSEGVNVLEIEVLDNGCPNMDYFEFIVNTDE